MKKQLITLNKAKVFTKIPDLRLFYNSDVIKNITKYQAVSSIFCVDKTLIKAIEADQSFGLRTMDSMTAKLESIYGK